MVWRARARYLPRDLRTGVASVAPFSGQGDRLV